MRATVARRQQAENAEAMAMVGQENGSPPVVETSSGDDTACKAWLYGTLFRLALRGRLPFD